MLAEEFATRVTAACEECFAAKSKHPPVLQARERLRSLIETDARRQEVQYRVLRQLVDAAALRGDGGTYPLWVALHDLLLEEGILQAHLRGNAELRYFDESYYLEVYPDIAAAIEQGKCRDGFDHFVHNGAAEGRAPHPLRPALRLAPPAPARSAAEAVASGGGGRRLGSNGNGSGGRSGLLARLRWPKRKARPRPATSLGVNLIGFHSGNLGLGVSARHYFRFLVEAGLDVCPVELPVPSGRAGHDTSYADQYLPLDVPAPHAVNLFVMNPQDVADWLGRRYPAVSATGKVNVALPFWELPRLPRTWLEPLRRMDVLLAASAFLKYAMAMDVAGPSVRDLAHPLYLPDGVRADRRRFDIPDGVVAFVCCFEMTSDINRKNPFAAIAAFERALANDPRALLIVKVNNARSSPDFAPHLARLEAAAAGCSNIRLFDEVLSYRDVLSLYASCDALISLHRAEGLGLVLMEAMTLGKPVVATAWSGNMSFTNEQNSCLVNYDLVPVQHATQPAYAPSVVGADARWADARVDEAAYWLRRLAADADLRRHIGSRAAEDLADYQRRIDADELVAAVRNVAERRGIALS